MRIQISRESDVPIADQLAAELIFSIASGELKPGDTLPSVRALARRLKIHHNTVSRAYQELVSVKLASSHPETHYLSFLKGCFLYQIQRFMGDSIGRQQGSGGRVLQMQFSTNTSPSKPPSIMASSDSFTTVAGPTPTD